MIRTIALILSTLFVLNAEFSSAQSNQIKVKVFDGTPGEKKQNETPTTNKYNNKNYISINPYLLGRGAFTVGYERILAYKHSVAFDLGLTYRDFVYEYLQSDAAGSDQKFNVKTGTYMSVAYKFYPKGYDDFDGGFYLSPTIISKNYNMTEDIQFNNGSTTIPANIDKSYSMQEYAMKFGYCSESWWFDDLIIDVYFGVGSRQLTSHGYDENATTLKLTKQTETKPAVYLGVKLGFVF